MPEKTIKTKVDELIELLEKVDYIKLVDAAKQLNIPLKVLQDWVDFLTEEGLIGIEYKFTTPYIFLNKKPKEIAEIEEGIEEEGEITLKRFKQEFFAEAMDKELPKEKIPELWKVHLLNILSDKKEFFYREARKRGLKNIDQLWEEYKQKVLAS